MVSAFIFCETFFGHQRGCFDSNSYYYYYVELFHVCVTIRLILLVDTACIAHTCGSLSDDVRTYLQSVSESDLHKNIYNIRTYWILTISVLAVGMEVGFFENPGFKTFSIHET